MIFRSNKYLHYFPSVSKIPSTNCKRKKTNIILVFVSSFGGPIYQEILNYLESNKNITKEKLIEYAIDGLKKRGKKEEVYLEDL